jgi:hypothetical protein
MPADLVDGSDVMFVSVICGGAPVEMDAKRGSEHVRFDVVRRDPIAGEERINETCPDQGA